VIDTSGGKEDWTADEDGVNVASKPAELQVDWTVRECEPWPYWVAEEG